MPPVLLLMQIGKVPLVLPLFVFWPIAWLALASCLIIGAVLAGLRQPRGQRLIRRGFALYAMATAFRGLRVHVEAGTDRLRLCVI